MIRSKRVSDLSTLNLEPLIRESLAEGFTFLLRLRDEWLSGANRFDQPGEALFVVEQDGELVGIGGLNRHPYNAASRGGRIRRLYIAKSHRRRGIGKALVSKLIETAMGQFSHLSVKTDNPDADSFYQALGFQRVAIVHSTHTLKLETGLTDNHRGNKGLATPGAL